MRVGGFKLGEQVEASLSLITKVMLVFFPIKVVDETASCKNDLAPYFYFENEVLASVQASDKKVLTFSSHLSILG